MLAFEASRRWPGLPYGRMTPWWAVVRSGSACNVPRSPSRLLNLAGGADYTSALA
jgi:hypothetical protein